jgi:transposase
MARFACSHEWDFMDIANRRTLEGSTGPISSIPDLPPTVPILSQEWSVRENIEITGAGPERSWWSRSARMFYRWFVRRGKKRGFAVGKTKRGKGTKIMAITDGAGLPLAVHIESASPHEAKLVTKTIAQRFIKDRPQILIGDKAYDSDPLDRELRRDKITLIAPHKDNRIKPPTQDGRSLRRYVRRWKVERFFAWLYNYRRIITRFEFHATNFLAFVHLGCMMILMKNYL